MTEYERLLELRMRVATDLAQRAKEATTIADHERYLDAFIRMTTQIRADIARACGIEWDEDKNEREYDENEELERDL